MTWFDVVVYTAGPGTRWRLGMVGSMETTSFRVPDHNVLGTAGLRLMADPIGSREVFLSERIVVFPGQRVDLTVMPRPSMSYLAIRW